MTPIEKIDYILEMIAAVDPSDMMRMAKIDGHIYCLINGLEFLRVNIFDGKEETLRTEFYDPKGPREAFVKFNNNIQYTRSRDLIKSLRPPGWNIYCDMISSDFVYPIYKGWLFAWHNENFAIKQVSGPLPTEELAELYATMATIKYTIQQAEAALSRPGVEL